MKKIFICYRTADEPYAATLIDHVLRPQFGSDAVFRASRSIDVGDDFEKKIFEAIRASSVLLVVIGPNWLDTRNEKGRLLDDPKDLVRREILTAFEHNVRVVPVLVNTLRFLPDELPEELARLARYQDVRVNFRNSEYDLPALVTRLKRVLTASTATASAVQGTVPALAAPVTRSLLVVGAEHGGKRVDSDTVAQCRVLHALVDEALASTDVAPDRISIEERGDWILAVIDAEPLNLLDRGVETLITTLSRHNLAAGAENWLRLRIAVHRGVVHRDDYGWSEPNQKEAPTASAADPGDAFKNSDTSEGKEPDTTEEELKAAATDQSKARRLARWNRARAEAVSAILGGTPQAANEERFFYLVSAIVAQSYATNTNDRAGAQLLLNPGDGRGQ